MKTMKTIVMLATVLSLAGGFGMQNAFAGSGSQSLGASVTIAGQCSLALAAATPSLNFGSVDPIANSFANGGASATAGSPIDTDGFLITLENSGNQDSDVTVIAENWDDTVGAGGNDVMSAGKTKYSATAGLIASKAAVPNSENSESPATLVTVAPANPIGTANTYWDLDVDLDIDPTFESGALSQAITLDFACSTP